MSVRDAVALALGLVVLVSLITVWVYPSGQDFALDNPSWNGLSDYAGSNSVRQEQSLSEAVSKPESTVLLEVAYRSYDQPRIDELEAFVRSGGLLLLADDVAHGGQYGHANELLMAFGLKARFSGLPLLDPLFNGRNQRFARAVTFAPDLSDLGIQMVEMNAGTALLDVDDAEGLAWTSEWSFLDSNGNGRFDEGDPQGPFPVAARLSLGNGSIVLLSDPSILVNGMIDTGDNHTFATRLTEMGGSGRQVTTDVSRLPEDRRDVSKDRLREAKARVSHPYSVAALLGVVVFGVLRPWQRKEAG